LRHRCGSLLASHRSWQHKRAEVVHILWPVATLPFFQVPVPLSQPQKGKGWQTRSSLIVVQPAAPAAVSVFVLDIRPLITLSSFFSDGVITRAHHLLFPRRAKSESRYSLEGQELSRAYATAFRVSISKIAATARRLGRKSSCNE
jgi:hypothetical protein